MPPNAIRAGGAIGKAPAIGLAPQVYARNGVTPDGYEMSLLANTYKTLAATRLRVAFRQFLGSPTSTAGLLGTDEVKWRFLHRVSEDARSIVLRWVAMTSTSTTRGHKPNLYVAYATADLSTNPATLGASTSHDRIYVARSSTSTPDDYRYHEQEIALTPGQTYAFEVHVDDAARLLGLTVFEKTYAGSKIGGINGLQYGDGTMRVGSPICDDDLARLWSSAESQWKGAGTSLLAWASHDGAGKARSSATIGNIFNGATGVGVATPGVYTYPYRKGSFESTNVPCRFWCYASMAGGATTGQVRLARTAGAIATISSIGAAGWYSTTANLVSTATAEKVDIHAAGDGTNAITVYAAGLYEHEA